MAEQACDLQVPPNKLGAQNQPGREISSCNASLPGFWQLPSNVTRSMVYIYCSPLCSGFLSPNGRTVWCLFCAPPFKLVLCFLSHVVLVRVFLSLFSPAQKHVPHFEVQTPMLCLCLGSMQLSRLNKSSLARSTADTGLWGYCSGDAEPCFSGGNATTENDHTMAEVY